MTSFEPGRKAVYGPASLLYVLVFVATIFSGSLYGVAAPYLILAEIGLLVWMNLTPLKEDRGYFNTTDLTQFVLLMAFCVFILWQTTFAMVPTLTLIYLRRFVVYSFLFLFIPRPETCRLAVKASKYYSFVVAGSIILTTVVTGTKAGGLVGDYQFAGMMMSLACILFLVDYYHDGGRLLDILGFVLATTGLFISGKRMFALIVAVSFFALYLGSIERGKFLRALKLSGAGLSIVGGLYLTVEPVRALVQRMGLFMLDAQTASSGRNVLWAMALDIFRSNQWVGVGFANFLPYSDSISAAPWFGLLHAHNIYLQLLAETGVIGFGLMIALFGTALVSSWRLYRLVTQTAEHDYRYVMVCSLAIQVWFLVYGFSGNGMYGWHEFFLYTSAVAMALSVRIRMRDATVPTAVQAVVSGDAR